MNFTALQRRGYEVDPGKWNLAEKDVCTEIHFPTGKSNQFSGGLFLFSGAMLIVIVCTKAKISWYLLLSPIILVQIYIFSLGAGFFLSAINVFFRDMQHIYQAVITAWMYATPLFYDLDSIKNTTVVLAIKAFNPLYHDVAGFRIVYLRKILGPRILGGWIIAFLALGIGLFYFKKVQDKFILYI